MHLYIEADFLIDFEILFEENKNSRPWKILHQIFTEFTGIKLLFDTEDKLMEQSYYYSRLTDLNPKTEEVGAFDQHFSTKHRLANQTLILSCKELSDSNKIHEMGGLQFTFENFPSKIEAFIETNDREFDFSDPELKFQWNDLLFLSEIPFNNIVIDDSYIIADKANQKLKDNLIPLLKTLLNRKIEKCSVTIFTMEVLNNDDIRKRTDEIAAVKSRHQFIQSQLASKINKLCFIKKDLTKTFYDQHDRYIYTPFFIISCGKGFNLIPYKTNNSEIICKTFLHKATYRKLQNHYKNFKEVVEKLDRKEVISSMLKFYPNKAAVNLYLE